MMQSIMQNIELVSLYVQRLTMHINMFSLAIHLQVVSCGHCELIPEEPIQLVCEASRPPSDRAMQHPQH
jgi:hypothetical protein